MAAVIMGATTGCGDDRPSRVAVSGRVLIDGEPLESGNVRVHPKNHRAASAKLGPRGEFTLSTYEIGDGCVIGSHPITVNASEVLNANTIRWHAPKRYAAAATSDLTLDVSKPTDSAEIELSWDGGQPFNEHVAGGGD